jgi:L,D-transpeptidase YcbB
LRFLRGVSICGGLFFGEHARNWCSNGDPASGHRPLSAGGRQEVRTIVDSGRLAALPWPAFSNYEKWVKEFYESGAYELAWTRGGKPTAQASELIAILDDAGEKGLDSKDYDGERWAGRIKTLDGTAAQDEHARVAFDVALTVSAMRYISDLHLGRVDSKTLHRDFDPERHKYDLAEFLRQRVMTASSVKEAFQGVEPPFPGYQRTLRAFHKYVQLAKEEVPDALPTVKKPVEPGQDYEATAKLAARLKFLGDLPSAANSPPDAHTYQGEIVEAVKSFQQRHGLEAEGKLGQQTIEELNRPLSFRARQLQLTLERWRWLTTSRSPPSS